MTEVSDRIADNRNGQFGFNTELDATRSSPNKEMQTSVRSTGLGRCFCYLLTLPDPRRSVGRVFCCDGAIVTTAVRSEESALIQSFSQPWEKGAEGGMRVVALSDGLTLPRTIAGPLA